MNLVSELDLPVFDYTAPDFLADRYHQQLAETRQQGWLAKSPLAYIVLDHDASRDTRLLTFGAGTHYCPGANLARAELEEALAFLAPRTPGFALDGPPQLGGVEGIYGIDKLPIIWSGSSKLNPTHGLAPDVS
jgi:cytochrome P450